MVRISKQEEKRHRNPHRSRPPNRKTGPLKDRLPGGYRAHPNAVEGAFGGSVFISKIK